MGRDIFRVQKGHIMVSFSKFFGVVGAVAVLAAAGAAHAFGPGLIVLEGSDAQTLHNLNPYSTNFQTGLETFSSAPLLPTLVIGSPTIGSATPGGTVFAASLTGIDPHLYSGVYIASPGACCSENDAAVASLADQATVLLFHSLGRSIAIENYQGGAAFQFITGFTLTGNQAVGYGTSGGGSTCFDGNAITATGTAFGLGSGNLPAIGCFGHQAYLSSFLNTHGFTADLADNQTLFPGYAVVASNDGGGLPGIPEPGTWALMLIGVGAIGFAARHRRSVAA